MAQATDTLAIKRIPTWRKWISWAVGALVIATVLWWPFREATTGFQLRTLTLMFILAITAQAWNLIGGYTGYAAFGNVAFFGLGAYSVGLLMFRFQWPFFAAMLVAGLLPTLYAVIVGLPVLRLKGHYFAIATLGVAEATREVVAAWTPVTYGSSGISLPFFRPRETGELFFYFLGLGLVMLGVGITWLFSRSKLGFSWSAIKADEDGARMLGIDTTWSKVTAFALSALLNGLAGGMYAYFNTFIAPEEVFRIQRTLQAILAAILGGPGTVLGPVIGSVLFQLISSYLIFSKPFGIDLGQFHVTILGVFIVLVIIFMPHGVTEYLSGKKRFTLSSLLENVRNNRV